jgi:hypothetical protein
VIASVALVFSMTGTGIAAGHYLITSTSQIKPSVLRALRGQPGPQGPAGAQGATGAGFSTSSVTIVRGTPETLCPLDGGSCSVAVAVATCPLGSVAIAGGFDGGSSPPVDATVADDEPILGDTAWEIAVTNDSATTATYTPFAVCAS